jgi:purine nucleosidase
VTEVGFQRAQLASAMCRIAGKSVPIHPGLPLPLFVTPRQTTVPQAIALERWAHDTAFAPNSGVDALRAAVRAQPGEITLVAIGR